MVPFKILILFHIMKEIFFLRQSNEKCRRKCAHLNELFDFGEKSDLFDRFNEIHPNRFKSGLTNRINVWFISVILYHQYVQRAFKLPTKNT